jgi:molybdopterin/thiamine biosynthesis adenylyltransferase
MDRTYHEGLHRGAAAMRRLRELPVTVCGAGALGANLAESLARQGFERLTVIDRDRVEEHNLSTQPYYKGDIGAFKAKMLGNALYRALGVAVTAKAEELTPGNAGKLLAGAGLVVDCFDNSAARGAVQAAVRGMGVPCLHAGMSGDGYAEVVWDEHYTVPPDAGLDACDYPLARNLVLLAVAVAAEAVTRFAVDGTREGYTLTLRDFAVRAAAGV